MYLVNKLRRGEREGENKRRKGQRNTKVKKGNRCNRLDERGGRERRDFFFFERRNRKIKLLFRFFINYIK